jgi:two-component system response regulator FixJ
VDLMMPKVGGFELQQKLAQQALDFPLVVITGHGDIPTAVRAMRAGAVDFVEKPFSAETILASIQRALDQPQRTPNDKMRAAVEARLQLLSPREREVLEGMVAGHPNKIIAYNLSLSPRTIEIHRARVMDKMQARSLSELVRLALMAGVSGGDLGG